MCRTRIVANFAKVDKLLELHCAWQKMPGKQITHTSTQSAVRGTLSARLAVLTHREKPLKPTAPRSWVERWTCVEECCLTRTEDVSEGTPKVTNHLGALHCLSYAGRQKWLMIYLPFYLQNLGSAPAAC